jgi:hypothetical protein
VATTFISLDHNTPPSVGATVDIEKKSTTWKCGSYLMKAAPKVLIFGSRDIRILPQSHFHTHLSIATTMIALSCD